jgi:hypothetical protein
MVVNFFNIRRMVKIDIKRTIKFRDGGSRKLKYDLLPPFFIDFLVMFDRRLIKKIKIIIYFVTT